MARIESHIGDVGRQVHETNQLLRQMLRAMGEIPDDERHDGYIRERGDTWIIWDESPTYDRVELRHGDHVVTMDFQHQGNDWRDWLRAWDMLRDMADERQDTA